MFGEIAILDRIVNKGLPEKRLHYYRRDSPHPAHTQTWRKYIKISPMAVVSKNSQSGREDRHSNRSL